MNVDDLYSVNLWPAMSEIDTWVAKHIPRAATFMDYGDIMPELLEVTFGLTARREFKANDPLGLENWGIPSLLREQFVEMMIQTVEEHLLQALGERPCHGWFTYTQKNNTFLLVRCVLG